MVRRTWGICFLLGVCAACSHETNSSDRHFHLTGQVKSLHAEDHTATISAGAIPNYMEAMSMDYPVKSQAEFKQLQVGERIEATLNVHSDATYDLSDIHRSQSKP